MRISILLSTGLALALAACGSPGTDADPGDTATNAASAAEARRAVAMLRTAEGAAAGSVTATDTADGIAIALNVEGLEPGEHGVHVHMTGRCDPPSFESAGGHWNPTGARHGLESPEGAHAGDMPNLAVGQDGTGSLRFTLGAGTFDELLDADGSAFVVHAMRDDQVTDPSGESGQRIACGVFNEG